MRKTQTCLAQRDGSYAVESMMSAGEAHSYLELPFPLDASGFLAFSALVVLVESFASLLVVLEEAG